MGVGRAYARSPGNVTDVSKKRCGIGSRCPRRLSRAATNLRDHELEWWALGIEHASTRMVASGAVSEVQVEEALGQLRDPDFVMRFRPRRFSET
jgi:hypothetical protein